MKKSKLLNDLDKEGYEKITPIENLHDYVNKELLIFEIPTTSRFAARIRRFPKEGYVAMEALSGFRTEIIWDQKTGINRLEDFLVKKINSQL